MTLGPAQTIEEKVVALRTILPLVHDHHFRRMTQRVAPDEELAAGPPVEPDDTRWITVGEQTYRAHRIPVVLESLYALEKVHPAQAMAVYYTYCNHFDAFMNHKRPELVEAGLRFMAENIPGYLPPFYVLTPKEAEVAQRRREIRYLLVEEERTYEWICKELHCSRRLVSEVARECSLEHLEDCA